MTEIVSKIIAIATRHCTEQQTPIEYASELFATLEYKSARYVSGCAIFPGNYVAACSMETKRLRAIFRLQYTSFRYYGIPCSRLYYIDVSSLSV